MDEGKKITCFLCHKTEHEGVLLPCRKAGRIFGYAPAVCLCSSMEGKTDNLISFPPFSESVSQSQAKGERQAKL